MDLPNPVDLNDTFTNESLTEDDPMSSAGKKNFSLVVQGGTFVIPGVGQVDADVGIADGKIAAIGNDLAAQAADVYDATGKKVLPGIFDPHTHIGNERSYDEEAETETRAAVLGGVSTIGIFLRSLEDSYQLHLPGFRRHGRLSYVNSVFHPQIFTEQQIGEISLLRKRIRHPLLQVLHVRDARAS